MKEPKLYPNYLGIRQKNFSIYGMKHPIADLIKDLIETRGYKQKDIASALSVNEKTISRKKADGSWTLEQLGLLEDFFGVRLLAQSDKFVQEENVHDTNQNGVSNKSNRGYKINIVIDPDNFNPQDFADLQQELVERMLVDFKTKQNSEKG